MDTLTAVEQAIVRIIRQRQRNYPPHRGVLPVTIACFLDEYRAQQTVRRDCVALWQRGELVRMGGEGSRRGYRVPPLPVAVDARGEEVAIVEVQPPRRRAEWTFQLVINVPVQVA